MDLLKAQYDRISAQLAALSSSQKMLTAALVAIMVMTLIWWGRYAGDPEMEPVLDQSFSAQDVSRITANLASRGIHYTVSGDRILVPADRKFEVIAALSYAHLMPRDTASGFDEMMTKFSNPFQPDSMNEKLFNHGKEIMLSQIIQNFPNVAKADVMIDPTREIHVSSSVEPSATVTLTMQDGAQANDQLVDAAADVVQGAQSGLVRSRIKVVVGGIPRRLHDTEDANDLNGSGGDQLELQQKAEVLRENQIKDYFSYIPDLKVFVTVKVDATSTQAHSQQYDPKKVVQKETETTSNTIETTNANPASGDPGVRPNVGLDVGGSAAGGGSSSTENKESTKFGVFVSSEEKNTKTPAGAVTVVAASVRVPVAYFEAIFTKHNPDAKSPTDAQLQPLIEAELPKIRTDVMRCTGLATANDVAVETYLDAAPLAAVAPQAASALSVSTLVGSHGRELMLGGLAVMSLFMVSTMVRKGAPILAAPVVAGVAGAVAVGPGGTLNTEEVLAGEVTGGGTMLNGMELDEEAVRNQQMLEQVSSMVKENPDGAANLVKRWMSRS